MTIHKTLTAALVAGTVGLAGLSGTAAAQTTLRIASEEPFFDPPRMAAQSALEYIKEELPKATNGEVTAELYPAGALGSEKELIQAVATGTVDATILSVGNAASLIPEVQLFSASYLFNSYDHVRSVLSDDQFFTAVRDIIDERDTGFQLAGIGLTGTRNLYNNVRVVDGVEDLEGLKMRVMASPTEFEVWSELGTLPTNIPAPEIYTSLQTGVVDAAESSLPAIAGNRYFEVAPNITLTNHQFNLHLLLIGDSALQKVPEEHRDAVMKTFREAGLIEVKAAEDLSADVLKFLGEQEGVTVTEVDTKPFANALRGIQDKVAEELDVQNVLEIIRSKE